MIYGYVEQPSPRAGEGLNLRVSTDAPCFRVEFYRCGGALEWHASTDWLAGSFAPPHLPFQDWGTPGVDLQGRELVPWPSYHFEVPEQWRSGVYVAVLVEGPDRPVRAPVTMDARQARALFVVRRAGSAAPAPILYKLPLLTYHAYNLIDGVRYNPASCAGHWCLYSTPREDELPHPVPPGVGLHRPGGGNGATPYDIFNVDPFDPTPRQTYQHWDARFVAWMEQAGYRADYCTDLDLHRDGADLLSPYRMLVSAGHDEYWSDAMRAALDHFVGQGGNAAFFGGNTSWWRVVFHDDVTFSREQYWHEMGQPENSSIGVSFRNGGERDRDDFPTPVGYRVQHADHWLYQGTGLREGDLFGAGPREYLIGYECDGAHFDRADLAAGRPVRASGSDGTPEGFTILGVGDTQASGWGFGNSAATMGMFSRNGVVFNAATTDWARLLTAPGSTEVVPGITRNVLDRLSRP